MPCALAARSATPAWPSSCPWSAASAVVATPMLSCTVSVLSSTTKGAVNWSMTWSTSASTCRAFISVIPLLSVFIRLIPSTPMG